MIVTALIVLLVAKEQNTSQCAYLRFHLTQFIATTTNHKVG